MSQLLFFQWFDQKILIADHLSNASMTEYFILPSFIQMNSAGTSGPKYPFTSGMGLIVGILVAKSKFLT